MKIPVFLESPFAGDFAKNIAYAKEAMIDSIIRGEAPFLSHLLYPQVLNDNIQDERNLGLELAATYRALAEKVVVYVDLGTSRGMELGIAHATHIGKPIEYRRLYNG